MDNLLDKVKRQKTKFIIITGGVCSSIGKGVLTSSLALLLKNSGFTVSVVKWDPYLNVDPGTMSPLVHGEVFVTKDGVETDLDLGHYERVLQINLTKNSSISSGQIYQQILDEERMGRFLGRCIQVVPHVVDAIKNRFFNFSIEEKKDFVLLEVGGTVGDMEGLPFLEAIRQIKMELGRSRVFHAHLSFVPLLTWTGEIKTKPTQHSVIALKSSGLAPDSLFLRSERKISEAAIKKLSIMCEINKNLIFQVLTFKPAWKLFFALNSQKVNLRIQRWFGIRNIKSANLYMWKKLLHMTLISKKGLKVGIIAKYVGSNDPYISVINAIKTAGYHNKKDIDIIIIESQELEADKYNGKNEAWTKLKSVDGIVIPGGFDNRGVQGKIFAARYARENKIPFFGLCLGLQIMLIEFARDVLKLKNASSTEFDKKTKYPVISLLEEQIEIRQKGGTMRLGAYPCTIMPKTLAAKAYKKDLISERHRHRYEFNNKFKKEFESKGIVFSGIYKEKNLIEIAEIKKHPFMLGTQFHPEFQSYPLNPNPLFDLFIKSLTK